MWGVKPLVDSLLLLPPNSQVVKLLDAFVSGTSVIFVFELMCTDALQLLRSERWGPLREAQVKWIVQGLLRGLAHTHAVSLIHRVRFCGMCVDGAAVVSPYLLIVIMPVFALLCSGCEAIQSTCAA